MFPLQFCLERINDFFSVEKCGNDIDSGTFSRKVAKTCYINCILHVDCHLRPLHIMTNERHAHYRY